MGRSGGRRRDRLRWSKLYTFACFRSSHSNNEAVGGGPAAAGGSAVGGPGFTRVVHCNNSAVHRRKPLKYPTNYISTTKYNILTFLPKAIFEQFRRVANLYFLLTAILSLTPVCPFSAVSMIAPLAFVVGLSMIKEGVEDWRRFMQDMKVNNRKVAVHKGEGDFEYRHWEDLAVGDVVKVEKDQFFPADLLLLSSSYEDGICYVETMNLDGETNLKVKRSLEVTLPLEEDESFKDFQGLIRCEDPNPSLYTFIGNLEYERQIYAIDPFQILLRDSKLRNTSFIYGVVIFTGHDSKVMQNSTESPSKRSTIEKKMDLIIYILFTVLVLISLISSIGFAVRIKYDLPNWWYLQPEKSNKLDDPTRNTAQARTSNLNEELGQVHTILSDKTGTLTCNQMDFLKCSIAGVSYGVGSSEVELAAAKQMASGDDGQDIHVQDVWENNEDEIQLVEGVTFSVGRTRKSSIKGFSFEDDRLMQGNWTKEPNSSTILMFFRILAVCHTAIPEVNEATGALTYEAESPDEGAFLVAAREFGFEFFKRTQSSVFVREKFSSSNGPVEREFKILNLLEFNSKRKRMSVILKDEDGQILLFCKGADSIIFDRLAKNGRMIEADTSKHLNDYELIERDLILVGATAVEDKLQSGVPQCIDRLAQAGLKIWVLTGDKMETAINIGYACSLLRQGMRRICLSIPTDDQVAQDANKAAKESLMSQIANGSQMVKLEKDPDAAFALVIDGKALTFALEDDMKHMFLNLAIECASVICCRVSPKQKALVTRLVKEGIGKTTLAIGDGANDVGMIQEADIGVGISGVEGMQICYFFYKNIAFGLTIFYFEAFAGFSGQSVYDDWFMLLFNVVLTSLPVISLGVFEQDVSSEICLQFPALYQQGPRNLFFDWYRILGWMANGLYSSLAIFFLNICIFYDQAIRSGGQTADMAAVGTTMFTCIIWAVNMQIALTMSHFTWIQHLFVWGSVGTWYLFIIVYGSALRSRDNYQILLEVLGPAPLYWAATLLVTAACNMPYLIHISYQRLCNPLDHHVIQEIKYLKKDVEDQTMWKRERSKARQRTKIGFTARVDAKIKQIRGKLHKKAPSLTIHTVS
uniref:P-type phospholipid transporter n=1 Tax=Oryza glumipatula TaxID=40148 RepID=A0A0E0AB15_9ORYZ